MKRAILLVAALAACGGDKKSEGATGGTAAATAEPALPAIAAPPLGTESVSRFNYVYGNGAKEYEKVVKAYAAKPRDWSAARAAAEATIAKDAHHLEAHWVLGEAMVQAGEHGPAVEQLAIALAGDWLRWGPGLDMDPELAPLLPTPHGKALAALNAKLKDQFAAKVAAGPLLLGRRSTFKMPGAGTRPTSTRGELYAYDREGKRFLRITHTDHQLAAWTRSPGGDELLLAGFDKVEIPDPKKVKDGPPLLARSWVTTFNIEELADTSARANIGKARQVELGYGPGDQLVVTTAPAAGRWGTGKAITYVVDRGSGKLTKNPGAAMGDRRIVMTFDEVAVVGGGLTTLAPDLPPGATTAVAGVPGGDRLALARESPAKTRLAFATATDPCADQDTAAKPSLYVADTAAGTFKHVLTASSRFAAAWIDENLLVYEDGSGDLRFYDADAQREVSKIGERAGMALWALSPTTAPLCRKEPIVAEPDDGTDTAMPPEEAPASAPQ